MTARNALRSLYTRRLRAAAHPWAGPELEAEAVVVAPHQDDETLGCGGVTALKARAGARVHMVFLTDGCQSHSHSIPEQELKQVRRDEGLEAARILGVDAADVVSFDYRDRELARDEAAAAQRMTDMLRSCAATQVFVPFSRDVRGDHLVANRVVHAAAARCGRDIDVYEYPVWFWRRWPWTPTNGTRAPLWKQRAKDVALWSWAAACCFRTGCVVEDVLDVKRAALEAHKSQMTRFRPSEQWPVLADVEGGDWLECFFLGFEPFRVKRVRALNRGASDGRK